MAHDSSCREPTFHLPVDKIQAHLEKILDSKTFCNTRRLQTLLKYLVLNTLEGRADEVNEYRIAFEVFKRENSFDPSIDPIVRVEISRLRLKLQAYIANEASDDRIEFEIPRGHYRLKIRELPYHNDGNNAASCQEKKEMSIAVLPLFNLAAEEEHVLFNHGLMEELLMMLTVEPCFRVAARTSVCQFKNFKGDIRDIARHLGVNFLLEGSIRHTGRRLRVNMRLINSISGLAQRIGTYEREMSDVLAVQQEICHSIITDLKTQLARESAAHTQ